MNAKLSTLKNLGLVALLSISFSNIAYADHKTNAPTFDIAAKGTNYSGFTSIARCKAYRNGQACSQLVSDCGSGSADVYATDWAIGRIVGHIRNGQELPVMTMTSTGHFIKKICTLSN